MSMRAPRLVSSSVMLGALALTLSMPAHAERIGGTPPFDAFPTSSDGIPADANVEPVGDVIPGELVVDVKDDLSDEEIAALGSEYHLA
ncbi:hypothetical protein, partial [Escherichia coli]|uniref:hypothetical protein n=1 Tax=Escherichia coli TaxID=562 RepID=UPI00159BE3BD